MPFRDPEHAALERFDPLARFYELEAALDIGRGLLGDRVPLRLIAAHLLLSPGEPETLAREVRDWAARLDPLLPMLSQIVPPLRLVIAAVLLRRGDQPEPFMAEVERVRARLRALGMRRYEAYEIITIMILRVANGLEPIPDAQLERVQAIYEAMKRHHYLLTGPEDYPACGFLAAQTDQEPRAIGDRAHEIYVGLRSRARLWRGDPLQNASNMLALSPLEPAELVARFELLMRGFDQAGFKLRPAGYDEVAALCFLARPAEKIVATVIEYQANIAGRLNWADRYLAFSLAANVAFVRLTGDDPELGALADAKTLLDMQTVIIARQGA